MFIRFFMSLCSSRWWLYMCHLCMLRAPASHTTLKCVTYVNWNEMQSYGIMLDSSHIQQHSSTIFRAKCSVRIACHAAGTAGMTINNEVNLQFCKCLSCDMLTHARTLALAIRNAEYLHKLRSQCKLHSAPTANGNANNDGWLTRKWRRSSKLDCIGRDGLRAVGVAWLECPLLCSVLHFNVRHLCMELGC